MSFDFDRAWRDAVNLFRTNRPLLMGIAGIFFFLPEAAVLVALPHLAELPGPDAGFAATMKVMEGFYARYWWMFAMLAASLIYGTLTMLALMKLRARPTVGEALGVALRSLPTYLCALLLSALVIDIALTLAIALIASVGTGAALIAFVGAFVAQAYFFTRLAMTAPVVVIEGLRNPIGALARAWRMTKGTGARLMGFFALVAIAFLVSSLVATLIIGLLVALLGEAAADLANAIISAGIVSVAFTLFACILAASYAQLSRRGTAGSD